MTLYVPKVYFNVFNIRGCIRFFLYNLFLVSVIVFVYYYYFLFVFFAISAEYADNAALTRILLINRWYVLFYGYRTYTTRVDHLASHVLLSLSTDASLLLRYKFAAAAAAHRRFCIFMFQCFGRIEWAFCVLLYKCLGISSCWCSRVYIIIVAYIYYNVIIKTADTRCLSYIVPIFYTIRYPYCIKI